MFSVDLFKSLAENSPDIIAILDCNLVYIYINPAISGYTGLPPDEIIGRDINFTFRSKENVDLIMKQINNSIESRSVSETEIKVNTLQGTRFFNIKVNAVFTEDKKLDNVFIISRDISELKFNQLELEKKERYIVTSAEALLQPFVILKPCYNGNNVIDFIYDFVNQSAVVSNGIPLEDTIGKRILQLFPLHAENGTFEKLKNVFITGQPWRGIIKYSGPVGKHLLEGIFEISAAKIENGLVVTWNDITGIKLTEERLKRSEKKFNLAFESSPAAMILSRITGEIVDVNKACESMFGYSKEQLLGRRSTEAQFFVDPRDRELLMRILKRDGIIKNQEFELRNSKKEVMYCLLSVVQVEIENEPHLLSVLIDITDQRKLESSLQNTLREKVILLQEVHHRVRNNMQIIISMLNMQRNSISDHITNDQLLAAQNRIRSMALVYDKLFPSDSYSSINLRHYLSALISESSDSLFSPEVHFEFKIPDDYSIDIESAIKIGLIINELFTNSYKHAFSETSQGKISIKLTIHKNYLHIDYSDNGRGIPAGIDVHAPSSLGLKLLNILVDDLNGKLAYSRDGECSKFDILLKAGNF